MSAVKLGLVTYNIAREWDIATLIDMCQKTGFLGVELRTTHAHGVEPELPKAQRAEVRKRFEDSGIVLWGLGTTCEFHALDQAEVERNIELAARFCELAADVGARGVKVRPNGLQEQAGVPAERTLEQIARALARCGDYARDCGVVIWLEVHGKGTSHPPHIRKIMDLCAHPSVGVTWNCNPGTDYDESGSIAAYFNLLKPWIWSVHTHDLYSSYPWRELFALLREMNYEGFTLAELPESSDPERVLRYHAALWRELSGAPADAR